MAAQMIKIKQRSTPTWTFEQIEEYLLKREDEDLFENVVIKREPLGGVLGGVGSMLSSAANSIFTDKPSSGGGGGSNNNQGGGSSGGSSSSNNNNGGGGTGSSGNNSGGGSGSNNNGGGSSSSNNNGGGGSSSSNNNNNNSGGSSSSGNNSNNNGGSSSSNNNNNGGSSSSNNNSGGDSSNNSGTSNSNNNNNKNNNAGSSSSSSNNNNNNNQDVAQPVTLSNGAVVTPISVVNQANGQSATNSIELASQSLVVVMTNSNGEKLTSTVAYTSSLSNILPTSYTGNQINVPTSNAQELNNGSHGHGKTNIGVIVGPIVAILIAFVAGLFLFIRHRKRRQEKESGLIRTAYSETKYSNRSTNENTILSKIKSIVRSPKFGPIKLPSLPSFNLHSRSSSTSDQLDQNQQPEMRQTFTSVLTVAEPVHEPTTMQEPYLTGGQGERLFGRLKRYDSKRVQPQPRKNIYPANYNETGMTDGGLQLIGFGSGGKRKSITNSTPSPASVYFSPQTHHPRLDSVVDALNSGELAYDDDSSSLGHDQQENEHQSPGYSGSESAEGRRSYGTMLQFSRAIGQSSSHNALSSIVNTNEEQNQNPFASPALSQQSHSTFRSTFQRNDGSQAGMETESIRSRDTFGISSGDANGIPSSPMSEISDSPYGFQNPGVHHSKDLLSPIMTIPASSSKTRNARLPSFTSIEEELMDDRRGIPDTIKNDVEQKRRGSFLTRR